MLPHALESGRTVLSWTRVAEPLGAPSVLLCVCCPGSGPYAVWMWDWPRELHCSSYMVCCLGIRSHRFVLDLGG